MNRIWDQEVPYLSLFDGHHIFYMALMGLLLALMIMHWRYIKSESEKIRKWLLVLSIGQQVVLYSWYIFETGFDMGESLPFHISRISSILGIVFLFTKNVRILDTLFFFGLFAYGSFFYPSRVYPAYHIMGMSFFVNHAITILLPIFAAIAYDWRPTLKAAFQSYGWFLIYFFFVYFLNPLIDGNYFYLKHRPFLGHLPDSIYVPLVIILTLLIFLLGYFLGKTISQAVKSVGRRRTQ